MCAPYRVVRTDLQSVVNHAIDDWRRRLSACVDAEDGHFEHYL